MQRAKAIFPFAPGQEKELKEQMLNWLRRFSIVVFLDSNSYALRHSKYECLLAAGSREDIKGNEGDLLAALQQMHDEEPDWLLGHICYDYKNELEPKLSSAMPAHMGFSTLHFFRPQTVCYIEAGKQEFVIASFDDPQAIYEEITSQPILPPAVLPKIDFQERVLQPDYLGTIDKLRTHIADGDCYEINYCTERYADAGIDALNVFKKLNAISPAPFAAYYRNGAQYMMCASPERYVTKTGSTVISQPIKGTAKRGSTAEEDEALKSALQNDIKERAENVMIVDLVRNDLARCCNTASVQVEELFGIYTFPQVHQMISTVSGELSDPGAFAEAIRCTFPMGSMTGAPKHKVMQLIEQYEHSRRELFSGTIGYITPDGDFDFNVIIRSLFYNSATNYLSYLTGGAITYDSDPEREWDEMRLKAWALERVFDSKL